MSLSVLELRQNITQTLTSSIFPLSLINTTATPPKTSASLHFICWSIMCKKYRCFWCNIKYSTQNITLAFLCCYLRAWGSWLLRAEKLFSVDRSRPLFLFDTMLPPTKLSYFPLITTTSALPHLQPYHHHVFKLRNQQ